MKQWRCSNKKCNWTTTSNIKKQIHGKIHIDLLKVQSEFGSTSSYRSSSNKLNKITGKRSINNHMQIRNITNKVGTILSDHKIKVSAQATKFEEDLHAYPEDLCREASVFGAARTHAPSALKNIESGS